MVHLKSKDCKAKDFGAQQGHTKDMLRSPKPGEENIIIIIYFRNYTFQG